MKKTVKYALCVITGILMLSCTGAKEKEAVECLKRHLRHPSTLEVISTTTKEREERTKYDTIFHIRRIYGERYEYINAYASIDSITIDSIKTCEKKYPSATEHQIIFEARNKEGWTQRDSVRIYETEDGFMTAGEYYRTYNKCVKEETKAVRMTKYDNDKLLQEGKWQKIFEL